MGIHLDLLCIGLFPDQSSTILNSATLRYGTHVYKYSDLMFVCLNQDALDTIFQDIAAAEAKGFLLGVKTVRGAYIEQERLLAKEKGVYHSIFSLDHYW